MIPSADQVSGVQASRGMGPPAGPPRGDRRDEAPLQLEEHLAEVFHPVGLILAEEVIAGRRPYAPHLPPRRPEQRHDRIDPDVGQLALGIREPIISGGRLLAAGAAQRGLPGVPLGEASLVDGDQVSDRPRRGRSRGFGGVRGLPRPPHRETTPPPTAATMGTPARATRRGVCRDRVLPARGRPHDGGPSTLGLGADADEHAPSTRRRASSRSGKTGMPSRRANCSLSHRRRGGTSSLVIAEPTIRTCGQPGTPGRNSADGCGDPRPADAARGRGPATGFASGPRSGASRCTATGGAPRQSSPPGRGETVASRRERLADPVPESRRPSRPAPAPVPAPVPPGLPRPRRGCPGSPRQ